MELKRAAAWSARAAGWLEAGVLSLLLLCLLVLGCTQVVLRNVFDSSLLWADPVLRASVLWIGLLGAVAAARDARHIRVDLVKRWLGGWPRAVIEAFTAGLAAAVAGVIAWHGGRMVLDELAYATPGDFLPAWVLQLVIPISFGLMALLHAGHAVLNLVRGRDS